MRKISLSEKVAGPFIHPPPLKHQKQVRLSMIATADLTEPVSFFSFRRIKTPGSPLPDAFPRQQNKDCRYPDPDCDIGTMLIA